jgi:hyperosmotically inducible periplasmic protein
MRNGIIKSKRKNMSKNNSMKKTMYCAALTATVVFLFLTNDNLFASETDDRIESAAKQSYVFKTYLKGDDIHIQSRDGAVTLTGTVSGESHKPLAWETVANLPGVKSVDNKLEVKGEVPAANTDAWLVSKVKSALLFHRSVSATETEVSAKNGIITLRGKADNPAQKKLATEYARDVEGVKGVNNEMTVSTAVTKPGKKTVGEKVDTVGESIDDASITAQVKMTLLYHRSTSAVNTTVETKEGVVELGGIARNAAEKDLASKLVSDVYGVKRVVNTMIIE